MKVSFLDFIDGKSCFSGSQVCNNLATIGSNVQYKWKNDVKSYSLLGVFTGMATLCSQSLSLSFIYFLRFKLCFKDYLNECKHVIFTEFRFLLHKLLVKLCILLENPCFFSSSYSKSIDVYISSLGSLFNLCSNVSCVLYYFVAHRRAILNLLKLEISRQ